MPVGRQRDDPPTGLRRVLGKDGQVHYVKKHSDLLLMFLLKARNPQMYRDRMDISISERRHIIVNLFKVEKDEATGRLMLVDEQQPPLLASGEGNDDQND